MSEDLPGPFVYTDWLEKLTEIKALVVLVRLIESFHSCMQECADQGVKLRLAPSGSVPAIPSFPVFFFLFMCISNMHLVDYPRLLNDLRSMIANQPVEAWLQADNKQVGQLVEQFFLPACSMD
jgi:hypothetical protein